MAVSQNQDSGEISVAMGKTIEKLQDDADKIGKLKEQFNQLQGLLSSTSSVKSGMLQSCRQPSQIKWIADTGATDHMFLNSSHFQTYSIVSELCSVTIARGGVLHVAGIGDVNLDKLGIIKKVLHAPNLYTHLISLQKLVDDNGWWFVLDSDDCFLCEKVSGRKIS